MGIESEAAQQIRKELGIDSELEVAKLKDLMALVGPVLRMEPTLRALKPLRVGPALMQLRVVPMLRGLG